MTNGQQVRHCACSVLGLQLALLGGCTGAAEPVEVQVPLRVAADALAPSTNDLGWTVTLTEARVMAADLALRVGDEQHASLLTPLSRFLIPSAHAHPGHGAGGEIVGELLGRFVLDFAAGEALPIGEATALLGPLSAVDLTLVNAEPVDVDVGADSASDLLVGAAAVLRGTATSGEASVPFVARLIVDEDRAVEAIPLSEAVTLTEGENPSLDLALLLDDPFEDDHFFDGVDFGALTLGEGGVAFLGPRPAGDGVNGEDENGADANRVRRSLQAHDFYMTHPR